MHCVIWDAVRARTGAGTEDRGRFERMFCSHFAIKRERITFHWLTAAPTTAACEELLNVIAQSDRPLTLHLDASKAAVHETLRKTTSIGTKWPANHYALPFKSTHQCNRALCITIGHMFPDIAAYATGRIRQAAE